MPCYHPLKGFKIGTHPSGKDKYRITSYDIDHVELDFAGHVYDCYEPTRGINCRKYIKDYTLIRCNQCIGCRLDYSRQWADRCMAEASLHDENWFITLTYNDEHLHSNFYIDDDGVYHETATLVKKDFQLFMKRLRMAYYRKYKDDSNKLRFFACGEYGDSSGRPHYHAIIFGLHLDDLQIYKRTAPEKGGFLLYNSEFINDAWSDANGQIGHVVVADVSWETCAYTARYIMKKQKGQSSFIYDLLNIEPEFTLMSRKPGIARDFYEFHKNDYMNFGEINLPTDTGGKKIKNVKYFDKIFEIENEIDYNLYKEKKRSAAEEITKFKLSQSQLSYPELLEIERRNKEKRIKSLRREL